MFIDVTDTQYNINMLKYYASIINEVLNSETKGIKVNIYKKLLVDDLIYEYTIWDYGTSTSINPTLPDSHYENYTVYGTSEFLYSQDNLSSTDSQLYYINIMSDLKLKHRKPQ